MIKSILTILIHLTVLLSNCGQTQSAKQRQPTNNTESLPVDYAYEKLTLKKGKGPGSVEIADFNKDGKPDIVVANSEDNSATAN